MFAWFTRFLDWLYNRCPWCKKQPKGEVCECEGAELVIYDDSPEE